MKDKPFDFFQTFKNVKILSSWAIHKQVAHFSLSLLLLEEHTDHPTATQNVHKRKKKKTSSESSIAISTKTLSFINTAAPRHIS